MPVVVDICDLDLESLICENDYIKTISDPTHPVHVFLPELDFIIMDGYLTTKMSDDINIINDIRHRFDDEIDVSLDCVTDWDDDQTIPVYYISDDGDVEYVLSDSNNNIFNTSDQVHIKAQICTQLSIDDSILYCVVMGVVITKF